MKTLQEQTLEGRFPKFHFGGGISKLVCFFVFLSEFEGGLHQTTNFIHRTLFSLSQKLRTLCA